MIIVFGILFWYPLAGVTYQFLHYLLGLRRLGLDVYYVEDSARWVYDPSADVATPDPRANIAKIAPILERFGFGGRWAFRGAYPGGDCYGMSEQVLLQLYRDADGFLNVTGAQELREEHLRCRRRIYVETDPVAMQVRVANGDSDAIDILEQHDTLFTFGENLCAADCGVPVERFTWLPTRQPVILDLWEPLPPAPQAAYNTIATWKNKGKDIVYRGETYYWSKDREFLRFIELPCKTDARFQLAAHVDVMSGFEQNHWEIVDPVGVSSNLSVYQAFIRQSQGEFTVAKDQNIRLRSGWFSDRSACYLAAGRPVITQETGFSNVLPTGNGLFGFETFGQAVAAVSAIESEYEHHSRAAREIATEYFDAERVLRDLLSRAHLCVA